MKIIGLLYSLPLIAANLALAGPAAAQVDNFQLYNQAFLMCQDGNNLGYPTFEICVQETYQQLLQPTYTPGCGGGICVPDGTPTYPRPGCNSAESRICST